MDGVLAAGEQRGRHEPQVGPIAKGRSASGRSQMRTHPVAQCQGLGTDLLGGPLCRRLGGCRTTEHPTKAARREATVDLDRRDGTARDRIRSEEHTSELQSLMRISYAVFCLKKKTNRKVICSQ